eukprot:TRINITY_DN10574_c1_g1_i1.p1 TRINITY_DN10574_c1_g1~~TRINITY_DN10574_c1_g1_i1.p1  ORF type:complete len:469 (-),score=35.07 TRINITY_DN10574_c1_g1_i1:175-1506(-)
MTLAFTGFALTLAVSAAYKHHGSAGDLSLSLSEALPVPSKYLFTGLTGSPPQIYFCVPDNTGTCTSESAFTSAITNPFFIQPRSSGGYVVVSRAGNKVYTLSENAATVEEVSGSCSLSYPSSALYSSDGSLIIADTYNNRILRKESPSASCTTMFGGTSNVVTSLNGPMSIREDGAGGYVILHGGGSNYEVIHCTTTESCTAAVTFGTGTNTAASYTNHEPFPAAFRDASTGAFKVLMSAKKNSGYYKANEIWSCLLGTCSTVVSSVSQNPPKSMEYSQGHYYVSAPADNWSGYNLRVCKESDGTCQTIRHVNFQVQQLLPIFPTATTTTTTQETYVLEWVAYEDGAVNHTGQIQYTGKSGLVFYIGDYRNGDGCAKPAERTDAKVKALAEYCESLHQLDSVVVVRRNDTGAIVGAVNCCNNQARLTNVTGSGTIMNFTSASP